MDMRDMSSNRLITADMLDRLPESVRRYMAFAGVIGRRWVYAVRLKQVGRFRQGMDKPWMPVTAEQVFTTDPPGFVWTARFRLAGLPLMSARDTYRAGHGHMFGKLAGLFTIFNARGAEMDQGSLLRYLGEMIWFPTAFLGDNITWQALEDRSAQVTLTDGDQSVSGRMTFDAAGRPTNFTALRYREIAGQYALTPWSALGTDYDEFAGLCIPVRGQVVWNLPTGDLPYYDWQVTEVEYDEAKIACSPDAPDTTRPLL